MKTINLKNAMKTFGDVIEERNRVAWIKRTAPGSPNLKEAEDSEQAAWIDFLHATAALTEAIDAEQKRCTARKLDAERLCRALREAEKKLDLPKRLLDGIIVSVDVNAQDFPKAYKYTPESTHFKATYKSGSWRVTDIWRGETSKSSRGTVVTLTEEAKAAILDRALEEHTAF